mmetsp:Transcript_108449/g.187368  ORF Transcript_108449/g.187368 Transcript_108449/m.187368 type:complete len:451 (+) Transcript_108449:377-1729(+)
MRAWLGSPRLPPRSTHFGVANPSLCAEPNGKSRVRSEGADPRRVLPLPRGARVDLLLDGGRKNWDGLVPEAVGEAELGRGFRSHVAVVDRQHPCHTIAEVNVHFEEDPTLPRSVRRLRVRVGGRRLAPVRGDPRAQVLKPFAHGHRHPCEHPRHPRRGRCLPQEAAAAAQVPRVPEPRLGVGVVQDGPRRGGRVSQPPVLEPVVKHDCTPFRAAELHAWRVRVEPAEAVRPEDELRRTVCGGEVDERVEDVEAVGRQVGVVEEMAPVAMPLLRVSAASSRPDDPTVDQGHAPPPEQSLHQGEDHGVVHQPRRGKGVPVQLELHVLTPPIPPNDFAEVYTMHGRGEVVVVIGGCLTAPGVQLGAQEGDVGGDLVFAVAHKRIGEGMGDNAAAQGLERVDGTLEGGRAAAFPARSTQSPLSLCGPNHTSLSYPVGAGCGQRSIKVQKPPRRR